MKKLEMQIEIPRASRYVRHSIIADIANDVNKTYRAGLNNSSGEMVDVEDFVGNVLRKELYWQPIQEPENRICFATIDLDRITLNENHRSLFETKPSLLRSCLSHEIGHEILGHVDHLRRNENQASLFEVGDTPEFVFHDSSWRQFDVTREEMKQVKNELVHKALVDQESRDLIKVLEDKLEPEWMYYQAEQFASCFLIPKDRLLEVIESGIDMGKWPTLYKLGERFGVSISMITTRLSKLNILKIENGQIILLGNNLQATLY